MYTYIHTYIGDRDEILTVSSHRITGIPQAQSLGKPGNVSIQVPYIDIKEYKKSITFYLDFTVVEKDILKVTYFCIRMYTY
jgi:hypothetical protein